MVHVEFGPKIQFPAVVRLLVWRVPSDLRLSIDTYVFHLEFTAVTLDHD